MERGRGRTRQQSTKRRRDNSLHREPEETRNENGNADEGEYQTLLEHRIAALETLIRNSNSNSRDGSNAGTPQSPGSPRNHGINRLSQQGRFMGRSELIPEFDGTSNSLTINQWLAKIDAVGGMYEWDDRAKIFSMIDRLKGNAKLWYDCQTDINYLDWNLWKSKLIQAFPASKGITTNLKELVNTNRKVNEDIITFYYTKLKLGKHCDLPDHVITDVIINGLNDVVLSSSAYAAGCKTTDHLLRFLMESNYNIGDASWTRRQNSDDKQKKIKSNNNCFTCGKPGHKAISCVRNMNAPSTSTGSGIIKSFCTFCKKRGHTKEKCFKRNSREMTRVNVVQVDDAKYHVKAWINGMEVKAYIDFGSACNVINKNVAEFLKLPIDLSKQTTMRGFGGALVASLGETTAKIKIDKVEREVPILVVKDAVRDTELLVGRTFTESPNLLVIKTNEELCFQEEEKDL